MRAPPPPHLSHLLLLPLLLEHPPHVTVRALDLALPLLHSRRGHLPLLHLDPRLLDDLLEQPPVGVLDEGHGLALGAGTGSAANPEGEEQEVGGRKKHTALPQDALLSELVQPSSDRQPIPVQVGLERPR